MEHMALYLRKSLGRQQYIGEHRYWLTNNTGHMCISCLITLFISQEHHSAKCSKMSHLITRYGVPWWSLKIDKRFDVDIIAFYPVTDSLMIYHGDVQNIQTSEDNACYTCFTNDDDIQRTFESHPIQHTVQTKWLQLNCKFKLPQL